VGQFNNSFIVQNKTLHAPTLTIIVFVKYNQKNIFRPVLSESFAWEC